MSAPHYIPVVRESPTDPWRAHGPVVRKVQDARQISTGHLAARRRANDPLTATQVCVIPVPLADLAEIASQPSRWRRITAALRFAVVIVQQAWSAPQ